REKTEATQKLALTVQSTQVLKKNMSVIKKNREKPTSSEMYQSSNGEAEKQAVQL
ncbi:30745_t:CDS:2, partial [Gigaspora margarita]